MSIIRTDYGLIYNTDGSLCTTLLPDGGVAVTEGTTNLVTDQSLWALRPGAVATRELITNGQWAGWYKVHVTRTGTSRYIGNTHLISVAIDSTHTWSIDFYSETGKMKPRLDGDFGIEDLSRVDERRWALTWTNDRGSGSQGIYFRHSDGAEIDVDEVFYYRWYQVEAQPYPTPFVEGTRPAGILPYPELAKLFNQREFTFVAEWRPYEEIPSGQDERLFHVDAGSGDPGNFIGMRRLAGTQNLRLVFPNATGAGVLGFSFTPPSYEANLWHFVAVVLDVPNMKVRIHLNGEFQEFTLAETPAMLDLQRFFLGCVGTSGQLNGDLRNVRICPYAVSVETVQAWYALDAPFFDPNDRIDAAARPIYAPGVVIDETGAWGISNGIKQAGFGTDGKNIAGGGRVVSDADGLRTYDKPYDDPEAVLQCEVGTDGQISAAAGNIKLGYQGLKFIGELGPDKPMIELERVTGKGKFRGEVAGSSVAWDEQMTEVTTEAFRQVNVSKESKAIGPDTLESPYWLLGYSQVNASAFSTASGSVSQVNASTHSTASGLRSQVNASISSTADGKKSQVNASTVSVAGNTESQINASGYSNANGTGSQINSSYSCDADGTRSQINASRHIINNRDHSIAGGYYYAPPKSTGNRKWHIFSNPGTSPTIQIATTLQSNYSFGDYGEYFESLDGQEIPAGHIVTLVSDKIRKANSLDPKYLGVISKTAGVILGGAGFCWQGRYLRDEFDGIITQEIPDPTWEPKEGQTEEERPLITVEVENPEYDPEKEYLERAKRPEWHVVGMLGQVHVRIDSSVKAGGYIKSNNEGIGMADESAQGWYVMKVTTPYNEAKGYGVALCLVK